VPFTLTKLSPEETDQRFVRPDRKVDLSTYIENLRNLQSGEGAQIEFEDDASRKAHVGRFNKAAKELGLTLKWSYSDDKQDRRVFVRVVNAESDSEKSTAGGGDETGSAQPRRSRARRETSADAEAQVREPVAA
jgi:hypothetical protein